MTIPKRKYHELSLYEKFQFNQLAQVMIDGWVEDVDKKMLLLNRFNLDYRDDVPMRFLMGVYQPEKITLPSPKETGLEELFTKSKPLEFDPSIPVSEFFGQETPQEVATTTNQGITSSSNSMAYSDEWIVMQNRLLHAISHLTLDERRLVLFLSPIIRKEIAKNPSKKTFTVSVGDYVKEYNLKYKDCYGLLERTVISIQKKLIEFWRFDENKKNHSVTRVVWVTKGHYVEGMGLINLDFHEDVIEMLTTFDKSNPFTKYQKEWITKLGTYGIVLLELILSCMYQQYKKKSYTVEYLREKFDCVNTYDIFANFKTKVINKAIKEIHENTPIRISYTQKKIGRAVSEIVFTFENTEVEKSKQVEQQLKLDTKNQDPYSNFKMTQKQLVFFASKIKQASGQDIDEIIDELSNVHLQSKHVDFLKVLDFVPSAWCSAEEIKDHPTPEQIIEDKQKEKQETRKRAEQKQFQLRQDYEILLANAEEFVLANKKRIGCGIDRVYFDKGDYQGVVKYWEHYLLNERDRKGFAMLDEILSR